MSKAVPFLLDLRVFERFRLLLSYRSLLLSTVESHIQVYSTAFDPAFAVRMSIRGCLLKSQAFASDGQIAQYHVGGAL